MDELSMATNSDGRLKAFNIANGMVMDTWQLQGSPIISWTSPLAQTGLNAAAVSVP